jgi:transcriptional regulator GlxA family with amidase domain
MRNDLSTETLEINRPENLDRRIDVAKYLLAQTVAPMETIALGCGWASQQNFTNDFLNQVGVAPDAYRRWHQC